MTPAVPEEPAAQSHGMDGTFPLTSEPTVG